MNKANKRVAVALVTVGVFLAGWYCIVRTGPGILQANARQEMQRRRATLSSARGDMGNDLFEKPVVLPRGKTLKESFEGLGKQAGVTVEFLGPASKVNNDLAYNGPFGAAMSNLADNQGYRIVKKSDGVYQVVPKK